MGNLRKIIYLDKIPNTSCFKIISEPKAVAGISIHVDEARSNEFPVLRTRSGSLVQIENHPGSMDELWALIQLKSDADLTALQTAVTITDILNQCDVADTAT